jgi:hypothetical protein
MEYDTLTFYQTGIFKKQWRWRYQAAGNSAKLANGGESYVDIANAIDSAFRVCGLEIDPSSPDVGGLYVARSGSGVDVRVDR